MKVQIELKNESKKKGFIQWHLVEHYDAHKGGWRLKLDENAMPERCSPPTDCIMISLTINELGKRNCYQEANGTIKVGICAVVGISV